MKEKAIKTLGEFLDKNKECIVEAYISNTVTSHIIGRMHVVGRRIEGDINGKLFFQPILNT